VLVSAAVLGPFLLARPAFADVTGPCDGSVTIKGVTYTPDNDSPGDPVVVPSGSGVVAKWEGSTDVPIKNHHGEILVHIGPASIAVASWEGENADEETQASGSYDLDDAYAKLPLDVVGIYRVSGYHEGKGGRCDGFVYVKIEGNPLATVPGAAAAALTVAAVAGVVVAAFAKGKP
jgi:hypothetical protein